MNNNVYSFYSYPLFIQHLIFIQDSSSISQIIYIPFLWFLIIFIIFSIEKQETQIHIDFGHRNVTGFFPCPCLIWIENLIILLVSGKCFEGYFSRSSVWSHILILIHAMGHRNSPDEFSCMLLCIDKKWSQFTPAILFAVFFTFLLWDSEEIPLVATGALAPIKLSKVSSNSLRSTVRGRINYLFF